jgi:hypothetical protein
MDTMTNPKRVLKVMDAKFSPIEEFPNTPIVASNRSQPHRTFTLQRIKAIISMATLQWLLIPFLDITG